VGAIHRAELFAEIERLAFTDSLTGVATRRAVETALEEACADPARPGSPAVVLCDIDDLKGVNDAGGHEAGDRALVAAADALVEAAKKHEDAVVGRFGGDEFCVLLPSGTAEEARQVALEAVRRLDAVEGERISCGVAGRSIDACEPSALLRAADAAQYAAKRSDVVDVVVNGADAAPDSYLPADGEYRAFRASGSETRFRRELLELLEDASGASADERLARVRERLERGD
jgi:diguanylate cyclase (GGDEF)-like protein